MGRIKDTSTYPYDALVSLRDYLIGSDIDNRGKTMNYPIESIVNSIGNFSFGYKYSDGSKFYAGSPINYSSKGYFFTKNNNPKVKEVGHFIFNKKTLYEAEMSTVFEFFNNMRDLVILSINKPNDSQTFGNFSITGVSDLGDHFQVNVEPIEGACFGGFENGKVYFLSIDFFQGSEITSTDLNYEFVQSSPSSVWTCPHGFGKIPSVTVLDTSGKEIEGVPTTNEEKTITRIEFSSPISGTASFN